MSITVLYVDTKVALRTFMDDHWERMSSDIVFSTTSSAEEALKLLSAESFDAVVAEYELPGMGGIELLKAVRAGTGHIPFILVSARGSEQVFRDAMAAGVDFYIHKSSAPDTFYSDLEYKIQLVICRQRSEQALAGSEELFRTAFDHAQTGMALTAPDGGLIRVNEKMTLMLDFSEDELKASTLVAHVHPDDLPGIMEQIEAALRDGIDTIDCELRFVHRDGSIIFTRIHSILIRHPDGQPRYLLTSVTDITSYKEIEDELREQEEQYRAVVESQSEFICRFLPDGTHVFANEAYCRYFGKSRDEIVGSRFIPEIPAEDRRLIRAHLDALTPEHPYGSIRHRIIMPDGSVRWQRWNDMAIFEDNGSIVQYQSVGRDITGIIAAEEALRQSEIFYRTVFEHTGTASIIVNPDYLIVLANSEFERLSGYSRTELEGRMVWTSFVADECMEKMKRYHTSRRRDPGSAPVRYTFTFVDREGIRREILLTVGVIGDSGLSIASLLDVSRSKKLEAELIESRQELAVTLDATTDGIWKWDFVTDTLDFSSRYYEMLGYEPGEFAATFESWVDMLHPDDRDRATRRFADYRDGVEDAYENDFRLRTKDGSYRWIHAKARVVARDEDGRALRIIGNHEDFTDRKNAELALAEVNKKLHLLSGITRHDILNQVMVLQGYLSIFGATAESSNPQAWAYLDEIKKAVSKISDQIQFTRDYEELGIQAPCWQSVPEMVRTAAGDVLPDSITLELATGPLEVYADPLLERVVFNLLQNSVMHGEHVSKVTVSFAESPDDDHGILVIADDGVGVPANRKDEIFRYGVGRHTGFGLFLVREILGITRMTIRETGEEGQGVRFEIAVPGEAYRRGSQAGAGTGSGSGIGSGIGDGK
jgi:PAS domain S-box-containing protein